MKHYYLALLVFCISIIHSKAQSNYYSIQLINKQNTQFSINNPSAFLSTKTIEKRKKFNIPIDSTDLPCNPTYIENIKSTGVVNFLYSSKWLNQVIISTDDNLAIEKIKKLPFVSNVRLVSHPTFNFLNKISGLTNYNDVNHNPISNQSPKKTLGNFFSYGQSFDQIHLHNGEFLHNHGFRGEGLKMCITDGGFFRYKTSPAFEEARNNNRIVETWDFVENDTSVNEDHDHGTLCFSTIAGNIPSTFVGTAPKASFYLYRTENVFSEMPIEELNWIAAAEKAEALGVDVISVSLGYTTFDNPALNHTYADMNGNTTPISIAADMAAKKGMIVVVAAGNSGNDAWHFISAPTDGDSVLAVGAVNTSGQVGNFSSYGPSSDNQTKPDVAATGVFAMVVDPTTGDPFPTGGTSFACPNMAGLATCLWQAFPEENNMTIINAIQQSANKFTTPDNRVGYGIPDIKKAFVSLIKKKYNQNITAGDCITNFQLNLKADTSVKIEIERKFVSQNNYSVINTQKGIGNFTFKNFVFTDDLSGKTETTEEIKYRIKMSISNDTTFYLDSTTLLFNKDCSANIEKIVIGPNPVHDNLNVLVKRNMPSTVEIIVQSALGQKVYSIKKQQTLNTEQYSLPFKKLSKGIYLVSIFINGKKDQTKKIIY